MNEAAIEKIKLRLRQLRQVNATNGATEGEVMNALAIAERLMRESGLDDAAIDASAPISITLDLGRRRILPVDSLVGAIGVFAEVEAWMRRRRNAPVSAVYYGAEPDVLIAEYLHELCYRAVKDGASAFRKSADFRRRRLARTRAAAEKAFTVGMVARLIRRLVSAKAHERARVDAKRQRLSELLKAKGAEFTNRKTAKKKIDSRYDGALYAGDRAGSALPINPGVGERPDRGALYLISP